jgi:hypothetical protein
VHVPLSLHQDARTSCHLTILDGEVVLLSDGGKLDASTQATGSS